MATDTRQQVRDAFPELSAIDDSALRTGVIDAWATAIDETGVDDLQTVAWFPPVQRSLGIDDVTLIEHVRDVTAGATNLASMLVERRDAALSIETVVAGALVHDVSKLYEFDGMDRTEIGRLLGHPHYGVHVVAAAGLPVEIQHVVLAHTGRTAVEPATLEAEVVRRADEVAAAAIKMESVDDLRDA
jgi:hypothetical protein